VSRLRDENTAEEVVQETFLGGVHFRDRYSGDGAERAWLLEILKRKLIDYIRRRSRYDRDGCYEGGKHPLEKMFGRNGNWKRGAFPSPTPDTQVGLAEVRYVV